MRKQKRVVRVGLAVVGMLFFGCADAQSLADKIGIVAAHLATTTVWSVSGVPPVPENQAYAWSRTFLAEGIIPTNGVNVSVQNQGTETYDAIRFVFDDPNGQSFETRQTISVWTVAIGDQDTSGKTDQELATLVTSKATDCLNAFNNRSFVHDGSCDGIKVFRLSIDAGCETGDWRDTLWAMVDGSNIGFSCVKKQAEVSAFRPTSTPDEKKKWFSVVTSGSKIK